MARRIAVTPGLQKKDEPTREKLLDAAEKVFSQFGFEGTSVRMINAEAQVDSGAIHYHFRTKQDLFRAVIKRRGEVLSSDRLMRLARCMDGRGGKPLVEQIVAAYILPYINPALGSRDERLRFARLRAQVMAEQPNSDSSPLGTEHQHTGQKFIDALSSALPHLAPHEVRLRYLIMWSSLNTLSAGLGQAALEPQSRGNPLLDFERDVPELIRLFAAMFLAAPTKPSAQAERPKPAALNRPRRRSRRSR